MPATKAAWNKPSESPTLANATEAGRAYNRDDTLYLTTFGTYYPFIPEIIQPGDVYWHIVELEESRPVVWDYRWCTRTSKSLDENFAQIQVEFFLNEEPVPQRFIADVEYIWTKDVFCRALVILVEHWPAGIHLLESRVTFLEPILKEQDLLPEGTHVFKYWVNVWPY